MTLTVIPASQLSPEELLVVFNAAYENYIIPFRMNAEQLQQHISSHNIDLEASCVITDDGTPISVAMLGRRGLFGWVGGVGVALAYRGQGIGRQIMTALLENARTLGMSSVQLEVIVGNDAAYSLYQKLGFETVRRLHVLKRSPARIYEAAAQIETVLPPVALTHYERLHPILNPWQRQIPSLLEQSTQASAWIAVESGSVEAYAVAKVQQQQLRWLDLAGVNQPALLSLVSTIHAAYPNAEASIVNVGDDELAYPVLLAAGYQESLSQWEMKLTFSDTIA